MSPSTKQMFVTRWRWCSQTKFPNLCLQPGNNEAGICNLEHCGNSLCDRNQVDEEGNCRVETWATPFRIRVAFGPGEDTGTTLEDNIGMCLVYEQLSCMAWRYALPNVINKCEDETFLVSPIIQRSITIQYSRRTIHFRVCYARKWYKLKFKLL